MRLLSRIISGLRDSNTSHMPAFKLNRIDSYTTFVDYYNSMSEEYRQREEIEKQLITSSNKFTVPGTCYVCGLDTQFEVDFLHCSETNGIRTPNWRERVICPSCGLNNRLRASIHVFQQECNPVADDPIYVTEQTTPFYTWLQANFSSVTGSEYLGDSTELGECNESGIRNEDFTRLSFADNSLQFVMTFDVLEHVPNYKQALREAYRCLKSNGQMLFSVPFLLDAEKNLVRARIKEDGSVEHLQPPEYHGDPINSDGCLCFYHFGWELLDDLRDTGFKDVCAMLFWSNDLGYLGREQIIFYARKA